MRLKTRIKALFSKRLYLNLPISLGLIFIFSIVCLFAAIYAQPDPFHETIEILDQSGSWIYRVNWLPIFLCAGLIYFLINNCALAVSLTGSLFVGLSICNYFKLKLRQSPLWPWDFALSGEVVGIAKSFSTQMLASIALSLIAMLVFIAVSVMFIRNKPIVLWVRALGIGVFIVAILLSRAYIYADVELYDSAYVEGNRYSEVNQYQSRGFVYSFMHIMAISKIERPPSYNRREAEEWLSRQAVTDFPEKPHVILIMSEAFSDIALHPAFDYSGYVDPLENYKKIKERSLTGHVVVPNVGGGTADAEFDVLTGINTRNFRGVPYTYNLVTRPVPSLASELANIGYSNVAIHPGYDWFYNRAIAYPHMGFDRFIHLSEFDEKTQTKGVYISEVATIDRIIEVFDEYINTYDNPFFEFCVTIQNHGPFLNKYSNSEKNFNTALDLTDNQLNSLYNYFFGLTDSDRELGRLTEYLDSLSEPVVLVYFGDHLPSLDDELYDHLVPFTEEGTVEGETKLYQTPYIVWANHAAGDIYEGFSPEVLTDKTISTSYLGALLLRFLGFEGLSPYFDYVAQMAEEFPVVLETRYSDAEGNLHSPPEPKRLQFLKSLEYHRFLESE